MTIYPWHEPVWQHLHQRYPQVGHALLFYGKTGCGKEAFTSHFIAWLLCQQKQSHGACGQCQSCIWLKSDSHPQVMMIRPDEFKEDGKKDEGGKSKEESKARVSSKIKIEKIREILPFVHQTAEGWRVILIEPAEALNIAASNALLKTLEEPTERVVIILMADHYLKLPATIRSRTQHFALDRVSQSQAIEYIHQSMSNQASFNDQQLTVLLNLSENMPLQALEIAHSEWFNHRQAFLNDWLKLEQYKDMPMSYAQTWQKKLPFPEFHYLLEMMVADVIRYKLQQTVYNTDIQGFELISQRLTLSYLFDLYSEIQKNKQSLEQNVQSQLLLEQYFIQLMHV